MSTTISIAICFVSRLGFRSHQKLSLNKQRLLFWRVSVVVPHGIGKQVPTITRQDYLTRAHLCDAFVPCLSIPLSAQISYDHSIGALSVSMVVAICLASQSFTRSHKGDSPGVHPRNIVLQGLHATWAPVFGHVRSVGLGDFVDHCLMCISGCLRFDKLQHSTVEQVNCC